MKSFCIAKRMLGNAPRTLALALMIFLLAPAISANDLHPDAENPSAQLEPVLGEPHPAINEDLAAKRIITARQLALDILVEAERRVPDARLLLEHLIELHYENQIYYDNWKEGGCEYYGDSIYAWTYLYNSEIYLCGLALAPNITDEMLAEIILHELIHTAGGEECAAYGFEVWVMKASGRKSFGIAKKYADACGIKPMDPAKAIPSLPLSSPTPGS